MSKRLPVVPPTVDGLAMVLAELEMACRLIEDPSDFGPAIELQQERYRRALLRARRILSLYRKEKGHADSFESRLRKYKDRTDPGIHVVKG